MSFFTRDMPRLTGIFVAMFIFLRIASFFTYYYPLINQIFAAILILAFAYICKKNLSLGWTVLVGELILDGSGHFFELQGLILRTWFLAIFAGFWLLHHLKEKRFSLKVPKYLQKPLIMVVIVIAWAILQGFLNDHGTILILQDAMLYFFLFLLFPALEYHKQIQPYIKPILIAFIINSALFSLITFVIYASGLGTLPDWYYHWYRNIAAGKITDLGNNFFRIVLPEHLFIVPIILVLASQLIHEYKNKLLWFLMLASTFVLTLNFSRIYFLALAVGLLALAIKQPLKWWFTVSSAVVLSIFFTFTSLFFIASHGNSFGLELIGLRAGGAAAPQSEASGAIRMAILPDAIQKIQQHPWIGNGLGTTITYTDPVSEKSVTRTQFDWGYLEMLAELGIIGSLIFIFFVVVVLYRIFQLAYIKKYMLNKKSPLLRGLLAGAVSLFVINLTTPALFQGFGVLYFVGLAVVTYSIHASSLQSATPPHTS